MIKIINDESGEPMFFVGSKEISKPNLLENSRNGRGYF